MLKEALEHLIVGIFSSDGKWIACDDEHLQVGQLLRCIHQVPFLFDDVEAEVKLFKVIEDPFMGLSFDIVFWQQL